MLQSFAKDIWIAGGPVVAIAGFGYDTRMAIIRLSTGGLLVWSPVALAPGLKAEVDALGVVTFIVAPNRAHHLFVGEWARAYPEARLFGSESLQRKQADIAWHGALQDEPDAGWSTDVDQVVVRGNLGDVETVFFHRASATVIFTDLIQHFERDWFKGWRALVARLDLMSAPEAEVPRKFRLAFIGSRAARDSIRQILQWPIERVLMAHGEPVMQEGHEFVAQRFRFLKNL